MALFQDLEWPACLCLQETNHHMTGSAATLRGYKSFLCSTPQDIAGRGIGWGAAVYVRDDITAVNITSNLNTELEAAAVKIYHPKLDRQWTICSIYIHKNEADLTKLKNIVNKLPTPFLLLGDFNARDSSWGDPQKSPNCHNGRVVRVLLDGEPLVVLNDDVATYRSRTNQGESAIDLSICSANAAIATNWSIRPDLNPDDHHPILIELNTKNNISTANPIKKWRIDRADWTLFRTAFPHLQPMNSFTNIDEMLNHLSLSITEAASKSIPYTSGSRKPFIPWWNSKCEAARKEHYKAKYKYYKYKSIENKINRNKVQAQVKLIYNEAKRESWKKFVETLQRNTPPTRIWNTIKQLSGKITNKSSPAVIINGVLQGDRKVVAKGLAESFAESSSINSYTQEFIQLKTIAEHNEPDYQNYPTQAFNAPFLLSDLEDALASSHPSCPGPDNVPYSMLQNLPIQPKSFLLDLINFSWEHGCFPTKWREATIIPIPKPGKDSKNTKNYRPISLTSCLCKTAERMVNTRLVYLIEPHLSQMQCGFRRNRSAIDPILYLEGHIKEAFQANQHLTAVFFDLEKAFDTTWRRGILNNLQTYGIRGNMLQFINNFLKNRTFRVLIKETYSPWLTQEEGVPQGSSLSATLFLVAINSIETTIMNPRQNLPDDDIPSGSTVKFTLFADDLCLFSSGSKLSHIRVLQTTLNRISRWSKNNGFKFSQTKTSVVHFCRSKCKRACGQAAQELKLEPNLQPLPTSNNARYLGLIFDQHLKWDLHIRDLKKRCKQSLNIMKTIAHVKWGADRAVLLRFYHAIIQSKLDYGCQAYGMASKRCLKMLDPILNDGLRLALGAFKSTRVSSLSVEAGILPLKIRRKQLIAKQLLKYKQYPDNLMAKYLCRSEPRENQGNQYLSFTEYAKTLTNQTILQEVDVQTIPPLPEPWNLPLRSFCKDLVSINKEDIPPDLFLDKFMNHKTEHNGSREIYTDGSKTSSHTGIGVHSVDYNISHAVDTNSTIFTAELIAIKMALEFAENAEETFFTIYSDSRSALQAIEQNNPKNPIVVQIINHLTSNNISVSFCWCPSHVGIPGNEKADKLATNQDAEKLDITTIPFSDCLPLIKCTFIEQHQQYWNQPDRAGDKLWHIKSLVTPWKNPTRKIRREETALARLRLGHTKITHGHLMRGDPPRQCKYCRVLLSVEHILVTCPIHEKNRKIFLTKAYPNPNLSKILSENPCHNTDQLFAFLRQIGMYNQI